VPAEENRSLLRIAEYLGSIVVSASKPDRSSW
jgi:hypothetical protein